MLSVLLGLVLFVMAPWTAGGLEPPQDSSNKADAIIAATAASDEDLGRLPVADIAQREVSVVNMSQYPIRLRQVGGSCSCIVAEFPKSLGPGAEGVVRIRMPVGAAAGPQPHWMTIEAEERIPDGSIGETSRFTIRLTFEEDLSFTIKPETVWMHGVAGQPLRQTVYLRSYQMAALHPTAFRIDIPGLSVQRVRRFRTAAEERPDEEALAMEIAGTPNEPGVYRGFLRFETDDPAYQTSGVPVHVRVQPAWIASPAGFAMISEPRTRTTRRLRLRMRDGSAIPPLQAGFSIDPPGFADCCLSAHLIPSADGKVIDIELTLDVRDCQATEAVGMLRLVSGNDRRLVAEIPVAWIASPGASSGRNGDRQSSGRPEEGE